jgi:hypothetical protein
MGLQEFTRDVVPIAAVLVAVVGVLLVWRQLRTANISLEQTSRWHRIHATYNFFDLERSIELEIRAKEKARAQGVSVEDEAISDESIREIVGNYNLETPFNRFLNDIEVYACAYFAGAIDQEISYHMHGSRVVAKYRMYQDYIEFYRNFKGQPDVLIEFEKLALLWEARLVDERKSLRVSEVFLGKAGRPNYGMRSEYTD